jgi:uncharacterized protein
MPAKKQTITLVGLKQAKKNFTFIHECQLSECVGCERFNVCMEKLEPGRIYKVQIVRDKVFPCKIHEEGVRVVEVVKPDIEATVERRIAFPGGTISYELQECAKSSCANYALCVPQGLKKGDKCKILEVSKKAVKCPAGRSLLLATLQLSTE